MFYIISCTISSSLELETLSLALIILDSVIWLFLVCSAAGTCCLDGTQDRGHFLIFTTPRAQTDHMTYTALISLSELSHCWVMGQESCEKKKVDEFQ